MEHKKRGDITTPVMLWFTTIVVGLLLVGWYVKSSNIGTNSVTAIDEDLKNLHYDMALACNNEGLIDKVVIRSAPSALHINASDLCILRATDNGNITRCLPTPCDLGITTDMEMNAGAIVTINKNATGASVSVGR